MKKIFICILALVALLAYSGIAFAAGNIQGREFNYEGSQNLGIVLNMSSTEVTTAMSPGGGLYATNSKAVALLNPAPSCTINRVRCYPQNSTSDLRIDPNLSSNWVGEDQANKPSQVKAVQTILSELDLYDGDINGVYDDPTLYAIADFQYYRNIEMDGLVGPVTWRALCSAQFFTYGTSIWGNME